MERKYSDDLQQIWDRLRILAITLKHSPLEEGDVREIGSMIEDILVDSLQPMIDALQQEAAS